MRCDLSKEDEEDDECVDPRVLLKSMNQSEAEDGDDIGQYSNDDNADPNVHVKV